MTWAQRLGHESIDRHAPQLAFGIAEKLARVRIGVRDPAGRVDEHYGARMTGEDCAQQALWSD